MPRVTIHLPKDVHHKLLNLAQKNGDSLSSTICRMAETGLVASHNKNIEHNPEAQFSDIERHCFKLIIQMNTLVKYLSMKTLDFNMDNLRQISNAAQEKYCEVMGIIPEEL